MEKEFKRGDVFYADLSPVIGSEQAGSRPVVIIQNDIGNKHSPTVIIAAITSRISTKVKLPVHVYLPDDCGLNQSSIALLEQIRTIDKSRLDEYIGRLDELTMKHIDEALEISFGLPKRPDWDDAMLLCLCPICASQFYTSPGHYIKRANLNQTIKDTCTFCNVRQGFDFLVVQK